MKLYEIPWFARRHKSNVTYLLNYYYYYFQLCEACRSRQVYSLGGNQ